MPTIPFNQDRRGSSAAVAVVGCSSSRGHHQDMSPLLLCFIRHSLQANPTPTPTTSLALCRSVVTDKHNFFFFFFFFFFETTPHYYTVIAFSTST
jgi:hypothetical protein